MKLSDWLPKVFAEGEDGDVEITTRKYSQFPKVQGEGIQGVGLKDGNNVRFDLTTDAIKINPSSFRSDGDPLIGTPEELENLSNQRDVNEFFYKAISDIEAGEIDLDGYATEEWVTEQIDAIPEVEIPEVDLDGYATEEWVTEKIGPIGERVEAGEVLQGEIVKQIQQALNDQEVLEEKVEEGQKEQEELKDKVAALEGSVGHHRLNFVMRLGVRSGEFALLDDQGAAAVRISDAKFIILSDTDADGSPIQIGRIEPNDIIRLVSVVDGNEGAELRVINDEDDVFEFIKISGDADRLAEDMPYSFTLLSSFDPEGLATIEYVDSRVDTKLEVTGDKMSGALDMQNNHISNVKNPATDGDAVNKTYADKKLSRSGINTLANGWLTRQKNKDGNYNTLMEADNGIIGLYNLKDPIYSHHAVNKKYLDDLNKQNVKKDQSNTLKEVNTFEKTVYFKNAIVHTNPSNGADTLTEVRGDNGDTKEVWHKIRGTNKASWICYPGQENSGYRRCMSMEWDVGTNKPKVMIDYVQAPTANNHAANKQYVDEQVSKAGGGSFAETGATTPSLEAGQLFYNTTDKVLYIGE